MKRAQSLWQRRLGSIHVQPTRTRINTAPSWTAEESLITSPVPVFPVEEIQRGQGHDRLAQRVGDLPGSALVFVVGIEAVDCIISDRKVDCDGSGIATAQPPSERNSKMFFESAIDYF
ncbi:MAG: hypothetical protein ABI614_12105 [Planctomycetota bacterium]